MTLGDWLWAIPVFGLLIFIHELGHFAVAKAFDVHVQEFALGFGPVLLGFQSGETKYNWRAVPLGGFVRMAGMEDGDAADPRGFNRKPVYARALVIVAGPVMNFVLAALLHSGFLYFVGVATNAPVLGEVPVRCLATQVDQGSGVTCPAYAAGLRKGDQIVTINGRPVAQWDDILESVKGSDGKALTFRYLRGKQTGEVTVAPIFADARWMVGIQPSSKPVPLGRALVQGPVLTAGISVAWLDSLKEMVVGRLKPQFSGPVGITREIAETASRGWDSLLLLTAFLSINLGMFNLLPIPALDGSRLVFMGVEAVRGRRLDPQRENMVHFVGFMILIGLMVVITYGEVITKR